MDFQKAENRVWELKQTHRDPDIAIGYMFINGDYSVVAFDLTRPYEQEFHGGYSCVYETTVIEK